MVKITGVSLLEIEGTWISQVGKTFSTELLYKKNLLPEGSNQVGKINFLGARSIMEPLNYFFIPARC